jgi:DNA-binding transcriptional MerR regulator
VRSSPESSVGQLSIGEFASRSRLSPKALRLYDELDLLPPARVDATSSYRFYDESQLPRARLIASLRRVGIPLARIKGLLDLEPDAAADSLRTYWTDVEKEHAARRAAVAMLIDRLQGKGTSMYEVDTRHVPEQRVLCSLHHADNQEAVVALGKQFLAIFKERPVDLVEGHSMFLIYHGDVNEDSDGPVEFCRPIAGGDEEELATRYPELTLRVEPAHDEAFVHLDSGGQLTPAQWDLVATSLQEWAAEQEHQPSDLAVRITFRATPPITPESVPECDFAVPFV